MLKERLNRMNRAVFYRRTVCTMHMGLVGPIHDDGKPSMGQFADAVKRLDHYARHGADFGATSATQYEGMADAFLNGPQGVGVLEKIRANGDRVRYDPATQAFGLVKSDGTIRTFYNPDPAVHGYANNRDYFNAQ